METTRKRIETDRFYGREPRILWVYNQAISDEFPGLFMGLWEVYETWYYHEDQVTAGRSDFLFDPGLPAGEQHWKRERFGNYLYGSLISVYFSWESLQTVKADCDLSDVRSNLGLIRQINGVVRYLFTALDAISCCIYLAEDKIPLGVRQTDAESGHLRRLSINTVRKMVNAGTAYNTLESLLKRPEFAYLSEYRNLLTHRPFPQFQKDSRGLYHFPEHLVQLDSMTQQNEQYFQADVGGYLASAFRIIVADLEASLLELGTRYRQRIG